MASLVDTNVLIYRYDERFSEKQEIAAELEIDGILVRKRFDREFTIGNIEPLARFTQMGPLGRSTRNTSDETPPVKGATVTVSDASRRPKRRTKLMM